MRERDDEMTQNEWWKRSEQPDDDGAVMQRGWLDDFDFDEYDADDDSVGDLWGRYASKNASRDGDKALLIAETLRVVQGFVDAFASGDTKSYRVTFDESVKTAGTDFRAKNIVISHAPLFDSTITPAEAQTILTAMAAHESSHVRYDRNLSKAVERAFPGNPVAARLNNVISDVRIERRYSDEFPGYRHVFAPAIEYVAKSQLREAGLSIFSAKRLDEVGFVSGSLRYAAFVDWTGRTSDRDWWQAWGAKYTTNDRTDERVQAIAEGLAKLAEAHVEDEPEQDDDEDADAPDASDEQDEQSPVSEQPQSGSSDEAGEQQSAPQSADADDSQSAGESETQSDDDESADTGSSASESDESEAADETDDASGAPGDSASDDESASDVTTGTDNGGEYTLPECFADAIEHAAEANDDAATDVDSDAAQQMAEAAKAIVEVNGERGEVYWAPGGIAHSRVDVTTDGTASASIRAAFARSRTGKTENERDLKSGLIDNRSLTRVASNDFRFFHKQTAPGEGKYNVWLLVDCSSSMRGYPIQAAAALAKTLAESTRSIPAMRLSIWGWTTSFKLSAGFGAVRVWTQGDPIANVGYLPRVPMGYTPDRETLTWAIDAIAKNSRPDEQPVILMASDGNGSHRGPELVARARRQGVQVISVAVGGGISEKTQAEKFGRKGYVKWPGSIRALAQPLGKLLARVVSGERLT